VLSIRFVIDASERKDTMLATEIKPYKTHDAIEAISSFCWHPKSQYRLLTITYGGAVEMVPFQQAIPVRFSPNGDIICTTGNGKMFATSNLLEEPSLYEDISCVMKRRASNGYSTDIATNKKLIESASDCKDLSFLWNWMHDYASGAFVFPKEIASDTFLGIQSILKTSGGPSKKIQTMAEKTLLFPIYTSAQRSLCLQICGWGFDKKDSLENALTRLESDGLYERAATIAVFHLDIRRAIASLTRASLASKINASSSGSGKSISLAMTEKEREMNNLKLVAMALAGCADQISVLPTSSVSVGSGSSSTSGFLKEICSDPNMLSELSHPYLKACFAFLCNESKQFKPILEDRSLLLSDRVAFACRFLDDPELLQYVERLIEELRIQCKLEGVLLTGLDQRSVEFFQQYINLTGDVQTAVLVLSHVVPKRFKDSKFDQWIKSYRELLDTWQLWHQRAKLDIARKDPIPPQIYVRCNFCNQALSMTMLVPRRATNMGRGTRANVNVQKQKVTSCPNCKKSLPHCALCLLCFNVMVPNLIKQTASPSTTTTSSSSSFSLDSWFTWCQTCRHGGHTIHMTEWFKTHIECPVTDCKCRACSFPVQQTFQNIQ